MKPLTRKEIFENAIAEGKKPPIEPITREEVILAKHAQREAGGDSISWNDLKDKPFGEEGGGAILDTDFALERINIAQSADILGNAIPALVEGEIYKVTVNFDPSFSFMDVSESFVAEAEEGEDGLCLGPWYDGAIRIWCRSSGVWELVNNGGEELYGHITVETPATVKTIDPKYLPGLQITPVIMNGNSTTMNIGDTEYKVGYSNDGSGSASAVDEEYGVSPAISLPASDHAIRRSYVHCGENLTAIKYALFNKPCFVRANNIPCRNANADEDQTVNFGGMCHWATTVNNIGGYPSCDALFFGGVIVYLVE